MNIGYWWRSWTGDWFLDHGSDFIGYHDSDGCAWDRRVGGFAREAKLGHLHIDLLPETCEIGFGLVHGCEPATFFQDGWKSGLMAPRADSEVKDPLWPKAYAVFRAQVKYAIQRGPHPDWPEISRPIQVAIQESLTGAKPPAQAMKDAAAKVNPILAKTPF